MDDVRHHLSRWWKLYLSIIGVVLLFCTATPPFGRFLGGLIQEHATVRAGSVVLDKAAGLALAIGCLVSFGLLVLAGYTLYSLQRANQAAGAGKSGVLRKTFVKTTQAADLISKKLFPGSNLASKKLLSCKQAYAIYEGGDCHFTEELVVAAGDSDLHFFEKLIDGEDEADPAEFPDEIDLKIVPRTGGKEEIAYLISKNEPRNKGVVVFFLPFIRGGSEDQRVVKITYHWKGLMKRLVTVGDEPFSFRLKSIYPVPEVEYKFLIKPGLGKLKCTDIGEALDETKGAKAKLGELPRDDQGMTGWSYNANNLPVGYETRLRLELKSG